MGYAQGPHGGVMGGAASGKSEAEVNAANQGEKNANALKEAVKSILSSKEYRELIEKELKKNKNVLDKEIKSILDKNKKAQEEATKQAIEGGFYSSSYDVSPSAVIGAYQDDPLDGLIEAPAGSSPGYQGAVTPGVSPPSVSHDFEGLIGQQENEAEEGLKSALGVNTGLEAQIDKDFLGTNIKERTVEERTKKEQKEAQEQVYQQQYKNMLQSFIDKHKELRSKLAKEHEKEIKDWGKIRELNKALQAIEHSSQYSKAMAMHNPALKYGGKLAASLLPGLALGPMFEGWAINQGMVDDTTPQDVIDADPSDNAPEGQTTEEQITDLKDSVEGGFWGLLGFAKKNPKIFGPLSGGELWELVMDEDAFWNYYEQGLLGE